MSATHQPVVVAIDRAHRSALTFAAAEALRSGSHLRVVHVVTVPVMNAGMVLGLEELRTLRAAGSTVLVEAREVLEQQTDLPDVEYALLEGSVLARLEEESRVAACLVVGADDLSWFDRLARVDVARQLATHASCPVVVVPAHPVQDGPEGRVVLALDGATAARGPLAYAFARARERDGTLEVLHAGPPDASVGEAEAHRANIGEVLAGWIVEYPDVRLVVTSVRDEPEAACARATEIAELVVLGQSHHPVPWLSRPIAKRVLRAAHCPVAVVPLEPVVV